MMELEQHPTVRKFRAQPDGPARNQADILDAAWLRQLALDSGADDAGVVDVDRPDLAAQRDEARDVFPRAKTLLSFVCRMNRENVRSPARSIANVEFHHSGDEVNEIARKIVAALEARGVDAVNSAMGFPMEMDRWPSKAWVISHKPVAVAAGLGQMGIHRNVIHPRFGNFILLGTVVIAAEASSSSQPIDYNPCLECKLCVAACPTGAIAPDGRFNFAACYTHNYREFMGGFIDWVGNVADSANAKEYRRKVTDAETVSMWQSLSFGANYKAAYCMAVCPAGEDVIAPFLNRRKEFLDDVVRPLQAKKETVYVLGGSHAEQHVARRFPHKNAKRVGNGLRPPTVRGFLGSLPQVFEPDRAAGLDATYHFTFTGTDQVQATVVIRDKTIAVSPGHEGSADLAVTADSRTWVRFLAKEANLPWALLTRKIRLKGSPRLLQAFGRCFPS